MSIGSSKESSKESSKDHSRTNPANSRAASAGLSGISSVFVEHSDFLKKFISRFLHKQQDIEDVVQEAYLKAYGAEQNRGKIEQPKAFLFTIAKNLALNELTRKSRKMTEFIEESQAYIPTVDEDTVENELEARQSLGLYCEAVADLPVKCRRVYLLRKVHGLSHKDICQRLNISRSMVEKHLRLGTLSCRDYMLKRGGGDLPNGLRDQSLKGVTTAVATMEVNK